MLAVETVLGDSPQEDGGLSMMGGSWLSWMPSDETACLDGYFTADELEAIAVRMRAHTKVNN